MHGRPNDTNATIKTIGSGTLRTLSADAIHRASLQKPEQFAVALIKYLRLATIRFGKTFNPRALENDLRTLDQLPRDSSTPHLKYVSAVIRLYAESSHLGLEDAVEQQSPEKLLSRLHQIVNNPDGPYLTTEGKLAAQVMLGKLYSLNDREKAAHHFQAALGLDATGLIPLFYVDTGVATYFTSNQIDDNSSSDRAANVTSSITKMSANPPVGDSSIVISVDARFFRIYAPTFLYYAQQLPDLDYAILVCGTEDETLELMRDGRALLRALDALNHNGTGPNLHFYSVAVPDFVVETKTFFACARFFAAPLLLQQFKSLTLLDADMTTVTDPREQIRRSSNYTFAAVASSGYTSLSPWRRNLAGNVVISREAQAEGILSDICGYLIHGLALKSSWMLDQNALTYGIERHAELSFDLGVAPRPFSQHSFRETWEHNFGK